MSCLARMDLGTNGDRVVLVAVGLLEDNAPGIAGHAAELLGALALAPSIAVPALTNQVGSSDKFARVCATRALGGFRGEAAPAVPCLRAALRDSFEWVRAEATNSLRKIAPEALEAGAER